MGMVGWVPAAGGPSWASPSCWPWTPCSPSSPLNPSAIWAAGPPSGPGRHSPQHPGRGWRWASPLRWPPRGTPPAQLTAAVALALGIGIQNFPEGAAIALPLRQEGAQPGQILLDGGPVRRRGAHFRPAHRPDGGQPPAADALAALLCSRRHAVCGRGGADPGRPPGGPLLPGRNSGGNGRVPAHDDPWT